MWHLSHTIRVPEVEKSKETKQEAVGLKQVVLTLCAGSVLAVMMTDTHISAEVRPLPEHQA